MAVLTLHYPKLWADEDLAMKTKLFWEFMKDMTPAQVIKGVRMFCQAHKEIFPGTNVIAYIRQFGLGLKDQPTAAEAWGAVRAQVRAVGYSESPKFDSPLIAQAVRIIGWREICDSTNTEATRAHFMKAYDQILEKSNFKMMVGENLDQNAQR